MPDFISAKFGSNFAQMLAGGSVTPLHAKESHTGANDGSKTQLTTALHEMLEWISAE